MLAVPCARLSADHLYTPSEHIPCHPLAPNTQAFLAGVAVGQALPTAGRQAAGRQRVLTALLCFFALVVLVGCALLLGGFAQAHPQTVYYM